MHDHDHNQDSHHEHDHDHASGHSHADEAHGHHHGGHDDLLKTKEEAAAFLQYTLQHNAHHDEELSGLVHSLQHLSLDKAAGEVASCIGALEEINARLEAVLKSLK
ncbi:hypothetical protein SAMN02745823_03138 [Sporobacter termitidis DSM 10068]|uniref:DUF8180 domain-containing protein n=1 Tax=Sporobacter termitidis DSM 10068 TaxID=1123282 RepID=A0A1M5Z2M3_9FIRM|nr:hypothetical protein [Sporobacter termitidis]SHI18368.1 hypothetical protein SAMN02745823_03138 [Sporobacter termitidis DSM 10068]